MEFIDLKAQYRILRKDIDARIQRVLEHGQYILGPEVGEMEAQLAAYTGARHCISCASGTEALLMALLALVLLTPSILWVWADAVLAMMGNDLP